MHHQDHEDAKELERLFTRMDVDASGTVSQEEFMNFIEQPELAGFLRVRGIDVKEAKLFFSMVATSGKHCGTNEVEIAPIVACCLRIKGTASSIDVHMMRYELRPLHRMQQQLLTNVTQMGGKMDLSAGNWLKDSVHL